MVYQVLNIAQNGAQSIKVISDDTNVFVLLMTDNGSYKHM